MEKDKSRGIKHRANKSAHKSAYKKNTQHAVTSVSTRTRPVLESNWDRYASDEEHEHKLTPSTDFSLLANVPVSCGSHQSVKNDETDVFENDLFCLNNELLHCSIITVPFYKRIGIDKSYFMEEDITRMDNEAKENISLYKALIHNTDVKSNKSEAEQTSILNDNIQGGLNKFDNALEDHKVTSSKDTNKEEDLVLKMIENCDLEEPVLDKASKAVDHKTEEDLEQWLDDILGE